jgi:hemerythrin-like domain-containing protein
MDAFELLKADHKKVAELFDRLDAADGKAKLPIFQQIKNELELHTHIEEKIFYPALEKPEETHDLTLEAYEEHKVVKNLLAELSSAKSADDEWQAKAKVLRENVEHHVDEEENELFDKADDALTDEQIESLGERMEAEKAKKLGKAPPKASATKKSSTKGILSRIANFVGLESGEKRAGSKKAAKRKTPAGKQASASSKATTKTAAKKSVKGSKKKATKRAAGKRGSVSRGSKKTGKKKAGRK